MRTTTTSAGGAGARRSSRARLATTAAVVGVSAALVVPTAPASAAVPPTPSAGAAAAGAAAAVDVAFDFEDGPQGWGPRGSATTVVTGTDAHGGSSSLLTTDRTQPWHGATVDLTDVLPAGEPVEVSAWVRLAPGTAPAGVNVSVQRDTGGSQAYDSVAGASATVTADGWTQLSGVYTLPPGADRVQLYVEGAVGASFLLDDVTMTSTTVPGIQDVPGLKDVLGAEGVEHVGVAADRRETSGLAADLLRRHYSAITPENDGKPQEIQPVEGQFTFGDLDALLDFADENGVEVYYHVLVWHSQTPDWFFLDGDRPLTSSPQDQALLRSRMEAHIAAISAHVAQRYPDGDSPIWAMDVVNEVIDDGPNGNPHDMRDSRWFQVLGEGFVDEAFRLADEYFPGVELFVNDYNTEIPSKRADYLELVGALQERGVPIDGVGHQAHVDFARPVSWLDDSMDAVTALDPGLLQAVTELDVNASTENRGADVNGGGQYVRATDDTDAQAAELGYYYRDLFDMLLTHEEQLESVTFWGISNGRSWLRTWPGPRPWEMPLPFDDDLQVTPAYWGVVDPSQLPARPEDFLPPRFEGTPEVRVVASGSDGTAVDYALPVARDTRDGVVPTTCAPAPGSSFAAGRTEVTCDAVDSEGNQAAPATFDVVVTPADEQAALGDELRRGEIRTRVGQTFTVPGTLANVGAGTLLGSSYAQSCVQTDVGADGAGRALLGSAPGWEERIARRDYDGGRRTPFLLQGIATEVGRATFTCTLTLQDSYGAELTGTTELVVDVRG